MSNSKGIILNDLQQQQQKIQIFFAITLLFYRKLVSMSAIFLLFNSLIKVLFIPSTMSVKMMFITLIKGPNLVPSNNTENSLRYFIWYCQKVDIVTSLLSRNMTHFGIKCPLWMSGIFQTVSLAFVFFAVLPL